MTFAACRKCGKIVEMTTEEAMTPIWCCTWRDRLCQDCYEKESWEQSIIQQTTTSTKGGEHR